MTLPAPLSALLRRGLLLAVVGGLLLTAAPRAQGGEDDFDFGKKLAEARYFDYARKVYDRILADRNRSDVAKDEARYGLALLTKEEAMAAAGRPDSDYDTIIKLFNSAADDIEAFVNKNPDNKRADQARLDVGTIRLAFVQWARELLDDPDEIAERGFNADKLIDDARTSVDKAISYFDSLRPKESASRPKPYQELASYYFVISQYYRALVEPPCSPGQKVALEKAGLDLEEYIMYHDGQLLAVYAQDIYGLVWWELAKCAEDVEKKFEYYNKAFEWFETCIYTDDLGPDHLRIITSGYYHIAQAGLDAGRMPERNFARDALTHLESMLQMHPTAWRTDNGLRALVEWSKLECKRGNAAKAIAVAKDAGERAKENGKGYLERLANRQLNVYVSGGCGGSVSGTIDPEVLKRVADDLATVGKHAEAIRAYQAVIASTPPTQQAFLEHRWHAWEQMAVAYKRMGDRLGEALALEPIHDAWMLGQIPHDPESETDENMKRAGNARRRAQEAFGELSDTTGSTVVGKLESDIASAFKRQYPKHPTISMGVTREALNTWKQALAQKDKNDSRWRTTIAAAKTLWERVATDEKSLLQDKAWVYLARIGLELDKPADAVDAAKKAEAYWSTPEAKEQAATFESIRNRRHEAQAQLAIWQGKALLELKKYDEVIAALKEFHATYPEVEGYYPSMAYDYVIQSYIAKGEIEQADKYYRSLLRSDPEYFNLARITFLLAGHYNDQKAEVDGRLREVTNNLNEVRRDLREASREAFRLGALVSDLKKRENKAKEALQINEERIKDGLDPLDPTIVKEAERTIEAMAKEIPAMEAELQKWAPKRDELEVEAAQLLEQRLALQQEIYPPLIQAAGYYYEWDRALKTRELPRDPDNVFVFAQMYWSAARLRPEEMDTWKKARELFEEYLEFGEIKRKPPSDPDIRAATAKLGDAYVALARAEQDEAKRAELVSRAVGLLQRSLADKAADNELVVGMLADKILVLRWRDSRNKWWRFPIPRPASVAALRDSVKNLGRENGPPLPTFENDQEEREYMRALDLFRRELNGLDDSQLKGLVTGAGKSTFDPILYKSLANSAPEFRLALAWIYAHTGREEDVPKAVNLALSLVGGPLAVEEDSEEWWRARWLQMSVYLDTAQRQLTEGTGTADAAQWLERAANVFKGVAANFPNLGEAIIKGNRSAWTDMLTRLNDLRRKAGLTPVDISLTQPAAPVGDE